VSQHQYRVVEGDIFENDADVLGNAVNCRGVMGLGIALEYKRRWPAIFDDYRERCKRGEVALGRPYLWTPGDAIGQRVCNFPTKDHWRGRATL
jgi:O-acetyl-ADP-ribose deacetylase (regulator of RNase III)